MIHLSKTVNLIRHQNSTKLINLELIKDIFESCNREVVIEININLLMIDICLETRNNISNIPLVRFIVFFFTYVHHPNIFL